MYHRKKENCYIASLGRCYPRLPYIIQTIHIHVCTFCKGIILCNIINVYTKSQNKHFWPTLLSTEHTFKLITICARVCVCVSGSEIIAI